MGLLDVSWTGDASPWDLNEDGWIDLYVLNMQGDDQYYENVEGKTFVRKSRELFPQDVVGRDGQSRSSTTTRTETSTSTSRTCTRT